MSMVVAASTAARLNALKTPSPCEANEGTAKADATTPHHESLALNVDNAAAQQGALTACHLVPRRQGDCTEGQHPDGRNGSCLRVRCDQRYHTFSEMQFLGSRAAGTPQYIRQEAPCGAGTCPLTSVALQQRCCVDAREKRPPRRRPPRLWLQDCHRAGTQLLPDQHTAAPSPAGVCCAILQ